MSTKSFVLQKNVASPKIVGTRTHQNSIRAFSYTGLERSAFEPFLYLNAKMMISAKVSKPKNNACPTIA